MIQIDFQKRMTMANGPGNLRIQADIPQHSLVAIYGPSGAGKTTFLKILAGLLVPDQGKLIVDNQVWHDDSARIFLKPQMRSIGFVFQDYNLFPNMTVKKNLQYALMGCKDHDFLEEILEIMEIDALQDRKPETLSGGQQQRVALARALVRKPKLLLLDEPMAALDVDMRSKMQDYIIKIHRHYKLTTMVVSHDVTEVFRMADLVMLLEQGSLTRIGPPQEIFSGQQISGKFKFVAEILSIEKQDIVFVIRALVGNQIVRVIATEDEVKGLHAGSRVLLTSKAFNPIMIPL